MSTQKNFNQLLIFRNLYQHSKNQFISSVCSLDKVNFRVLSSDWHHPFLTMHTSKIFNHLLICVNLHQHAKNLLSPSVHSWNTVNFKLHRSNWQHPFLTMLSQKKKKKKLTNFYFYEFVSTRKKLHCLINSLWRYS